MAKTLLTISDGNGSSSANFIKWPKLLQALTLDSLQITNKSIPGASNELILMQLAETLRNEAVDCAIIQWTFPQRVDLILTDFWSDQAKDDSVYHSNIFDSNGARWWVTSHSDNKYIREYHNRYIGDWHSTQRSQVYMLAAAELLKNKQIPFVLCLAYHFDFVAPTKEVIEALPWVWHEPNKGLSEFRSSSQFYNLDQGLANPHSAIQLDWINAVLKPKCEFVDYPEIRYYNIQKHLTR
jgi:hypothetical protein